MRKLIGRSALLMALAFLIVAAAGMIDAARAKDGKIPLFYSSIFTQPGDPQPTLHYHSAV